MGGGGASGLGIGLVLATGIRSACSFLSANILVARLYSSGAVVMYKIARSRPLASALTAVRVYRA